MNKKVTLDTHIRNKKKFKETANFWNNKLALTNRGQVIWELDIDEVKSKFTHKRFSQLEPKQQKEFVKEYFIHKKDWKGNSYHSGFISDTLRHAIQKSRKVECDCTQCTYKERERERKGREKKRLGRKDLKEFEVDLSYQEDISKTLTVTVKAGDVEEARQYVLDNLNEGEDFLNSGDWEEDSEGGFEPEIDEIRDQDGNVVDGEDEDDDEDDEDEDEDDDE